MAIYSDEEEQNAKDWNDQLAIDNAEVVFSEMGKVDSNVSYMAFHCGHITFKKKDYEFTLCEMYDSNSDSTDYEITWADEEPEKSKELEDKIIDSL